MGLTSFSFIFLTLTPLIFSLITQTSAQTAPAPAPAGPVNLTGILDKNGQFTTFIRFLTDTRVSEQIENQLKHSDQGFTVFAPTDSAFTNLPGGALNGLSIQQQVQLVLYHVAPKYYTLSDLLTVSNPLRTQATGQEGRLFGLNFTGHDNQVNVTTGVVTTQINNALRQQFPLAVYQVDKVLLPVELFGAKSPALAPAPKPEAETPSGRGSSVSTESGAKSVESDEGDAARSVGLGFVIGLGFLCMGILSL